MSTLSFKDYIVEQEKVMYFTFGRMNPPTTGHEKLLQALSKKAGSNPFRIYLSQSQDAKKNPLSYSDKIKYARKFFPKYARQIILDKDIKTIFDILVKLNDEGIKKIVMVVGSDRINEFNVLVNKFNGVKARHGFYNFQSIDIVSAGERDPDSEDVSGMSASKQREAAANNDFISFQQGVPKVVGNDDARKLFNALRTGMGLKEQTDFKKHVALEPVSETRELYVKGELFFEGDSVVVKESDEVGNIISLGANYVLVEMADGRKLRKWLTDVDKL
jgi:nicotinamide mononucleotide adenylyltransferase